MLIFFSAWRDPDLQLFCRPLLFLSQSTSWQHPPPPRERDTEAKKREMYELICIEIVNRYVKTSLVIHVRKMLLMELNYLNSNPQNFFSCFNSVGPHVLKD